ncbi:hypothetical protein [Curtobacterium sp. MCBD17_008]|uniref:hypothetical protein n=1 Tax=Curtobacterium sp. MCBD17_008 TaxID=2175656 RepID=UPI000DAA7722|nr:hypothetical protein [Curtobacterium sp. MCBD17_008]PZE89936.1 hypothetical protein DEI95_13010 [Curtobacterium sp. MCBD17_008]
MWTFHICATRTGEKITQVTPTSGSFTRRMNGVGSGTHSFIAADLGAGETVNARRSSRVDLTRTWSRTLVQCWDDKPIYAGLIVGKTTKTDGTVDISTVEFRELLKYRTTFGISGYNGKADEQLLLKNQTLASIAGYLIWDVMQGPTSNWQLPLILPPRNITGPHDRTYHEYNLPVIETELAAIQSTLSGPDVDFEPSWADDNTLQWTARVGDLTGNTLEWNLAVEKPALTDFTFQEDGNKQGNVFYAVGNGSDRDMLLATSSTAIPSDELALERFVRYSQEKQIDVLQRRANENLRVYKTPTRQYSYAMQADGTPGLQQLRIGQTLNTYLADNEWITDGWVENRLIGFSGDLTNTIKLQLQ